MRKSENTITWQPCPNKNAKTASSSVQHGQRNMRDAEANASDNATKKVPTEQDAEMKVYHTTASESKRDRESHSHRCCGLRNGEV